MFVAALLLAVLVGMAIGLLGGGGSILSLPTLVYVAGLDPKEAIPMELIAVGATSLAALTLHAAAGNVRWRTGLTFGLASMAGAYTGGRNAHWFAGSTLLALFATLMAISAVAMLSGKRPRRDQGHRVSLAPASLPPSPRCKPTLWKPALVVGEGFVVGALTGLVGAGGGFMIVPTLVVLGGLSMHAAVGTSVFIIALNSFAGAAGHLSHADVPWRFTAAFAAIAVVASLFGARLASTVPQARLRRGFGLFVLAMGGVILGQESGLFAAMRERVWLAIPVAVALVLTVFMITREMIRPASSELRD
jgi:uncharacterized membrane protein YfcA